MVVVINVFSFAIRRGESVVLIGCFPLRFDLVKRQKWKRYGRGKSPRNENKRVKKQETCIDGVSSTIGVFLGIGVGCSVIYSAICVLLLMTLLNTLYIDIYIDSVLDLDGQVEMRWDQKGVAWHMISL